MNIKVIEGREFLSKIDGHISWNFSTALNNINYKKECNEGIENIEKLKEIFGLEKVCYLNQTHSNDVIDITKKEVCGEKDGDAIIIKDKNVAIGIFTADCVPVLIYDKEKSVIAAIHSGWKGTFYEIVKKTCINMHEEYKCENLNVVIGPHIKSCCYEVSEELEKKFTDKFGVESSKKRMLDLEKCVQKQIAQLNFIESIEKINICTHCNKDFKMHSYRKDKENAGRLFSFIYIK